MDGAAESYFCSADFKKRLLTKITACVGVGVYSLRLHYDDGTESPVIGSRSDLSAEIELGRD